MRLQTVNAVALVASLFAAMAAVLATDAPLGAPPRLVGVQPDMAAPREVVDARGHAVEVRPYQRIVSMNPVADPILLQLVEPERLIGVSGYSRDTHPDGFRFGARAGVASSNNLEEVLGLRPDLVIVSKFADEAVLERMRESAIPVFDLGDAIGVATTVANIRTLGALLGVPDRSARLESQYVLALDALDASVRDRDRAPGVYLSVYGDSFLGGTTGSSYADVLYYAGVRDLAAERGFRGWPSYSTEELLRMDPPLIVTSPGMGATLCGHSSLRRVAACGPGGRVVEVNSEFLGDPGLGLVHGAEAALRLIHPNLEASGTSAAPSFGAAGSR